MIGVYPRACGGTGAGRTWFLGVEGLSPRVRGNPSATMCSCSRDRSIPARAGEPMRSDHRPSWSAVYPRACGGTVQADIWTSDVMGLSPRVRGNRPRRRSVFPGSGSIPARAGEPLVTCVCAPLRRVYPRACGGTGGAHCFATRFPGLSPRVRGNPPAQTV